MTNLEYNYDDIYYHKLYTFSEENGQLFDNWNM